MRNHLISSTASVMMMMMFQPLVDFNILFYHVSFDYDLIQRLPIQYFLIYWNQYHIIILEHALCQPKDYALFFLELGGKSRVYGQIFLTT